MSALSLLGLTDKIVGTLEVTAPFGYHPNRQRIDHLEIHYERRLDRYSFGIVEKETIFGNKVRVYGEEKTIVDLIRNRKDYEDEVFIKAIKDYARKKDRDTKALYDYAKLVNSEQAVFDLMGKYAFAYCSSLTSVTFATGSVLTSIEDYAFDGCIRLTTFTAPSTVASIGAYAFDECRVLANFSFPASLTSIETYAFQNCGLTTALFPTALASIGDEAFFGCPGLTSVAFPASLTSLGDQAFYGCSALTSIVVDSANANFETDGKALYDKGKTQLLQYACGLRGSYTVPATVESIGSNAFSGSDRLTDVVFAAGSVLTSIKFNAFSSSTGLTSVTLPAPLTSIGDWAFEDCPNLETLNYSSTKADWAKVTLGTGWHNNCTLLKAVTCTDGTVTL